MNRELMPKRLELLKEATPGLTRVGYLANPTYAGHQPQLHEMQGAARSLGIELHLFEVREGSELERAFAGMAAAHVGAFIVQQDVLFGAHRRTIIALAAQSRLPGMYPGSFYPDDGGLISYAAHIEDLCRRTATRSTPVTVEDIALESRDALNGLGTDQAALEATRFQCLEQRNPIDARGCHSNRLDATVDKTRQPASGDPPCTCQTSARSAGPHRRARRQRAHGRQCRRPRRGGDLAHAPRTGRVSPCEDRAR